MDHKWLVGILASAAAALIGILLSVFASAMFQQDDRIRALERESHIHQGEALARRRGVEPNP